ncbi:uncharacterized protein LOC132619657 [Lycium barbarum]|uniref:uncharacterized protein LOC132619657 n=1 Tax=Lycium barbarum TaxID=112863 RepID=UPI00293F2B39|nr:uncharacterized protein LOC132619657 [Lycium barbarum]
MVSDMRARVRRFVGGLDSYLYDGANIAAQNGGITISKMVAFVQGNETRLKEAEALRKEKDKEFNKRVKSTGKCGKRHPGECRIGVDICYGCGQRGHFQRDCPLARQGTGGNVAQSTNSAAPRHNQSQQGHGTTRSGNTGGGQNRLYALTGRQNTQARADVVTGFSFSFRPYHVTLMCHVYFIQLLYIQVHSMS